MQNSRGKVMVGLLLSVLVGGVFSSCKHNDLKPFSATEKLITMLQSYDSIYTEGINRSYDYVVCASPWPEGIVCITGVMDGNVTREYLLKLDYKGKYVYLITGFEPLLQARTSDMHIEDEHSSVYDPPTLCFERKGEDQYVICNDPYKCWHCLSPPPPSSAPLIKFQDGNE